MYFARVQDVKGGGKNNTKTFLVSMLLFCDLLIEISVIRHQATKIGFPAGADFGHP